MRRARQWLIPGLGLSASLLLAGCDREPETTTAGPADAAASAAAAVAPRWYRDAQVAAGEPLYQQHCAGCHQPDASGTTDWRQVDAQGRLPPPPLNGTAHTWHHDLSVLRRVVRDGGVRLGGSMPGFAAQLDATQIDAILAWLQSHWPDDIYALWYARDQAVRQR